MHEAEKRAANDEQVKSLQSNIDDMAAELTDVSTKLQEAAVQLSKEKARNKAVVEHTSVSDYSRCLGLFDCCLLFCGLMGMLQVPWIMASTALRFLSCLLYTSDAADE